MSFKNNYKLANTDFIRGKKKYNKRPTLEYLKEDMQQRWTENGHARIYYDQYGFEIQYPEKKQGQYILSRFGEQLVRTNTLLAAKEISRIIINDQILRL